MSNRPEKPELVTVLDTGPRREPSCASCRFFDSLTHAAADEGSCRRRAPEPPGQPWRWPWPQVSWSDWCGEWEPGP